MLVEERRERKRGPAGGERGREELEEEERRGWKRGAGGVREVTGGADQVKTPSSFTWSTHLLLVTDSSAPLLLQSSSSPQL